MLLQRLHFNKETMLELMRIAIPMIVSQGTFAVMIFTDRYFMSQIDPIHMAAALLLHSSHSVSSPVYFPTRMRWLPSIWVLVKSRNAQR